MTDLLKDLREQLPHILFKRIKAELEAENWEDALEFSDHFFWRYPDHEYNDKIENIFFDISKKEIENENHDRAIFLVEYFFRTFEQSQYLLNLYSLCSEVGLQLIQELIQEKKKEIGEKYLDRLAFYGTFNSSLYILKITEEFERLNPKKAFILLNHILEMVKGTSIYNITINEEFIRRLHISFALFIWDCFNAQVLPGITELDLSSLDDLSNYWEDHFVEPLKSYAKHFNNFNTHFFGKPACKHDSYQFLTTEIRQSPIPLVSVVEYWHMINLTIENCYRKAVRSISKLRLEQAKKKKVISIYEIKELLNEKTPKSLAI